MHVANNVNNARAKFGRRSSNTLEVINDTGDMTLMAPRNESVRFGKTRIK